MPTDEHPVSNKMTELRTPALITKPLIILMTETWSPPTIIDVEQSLGDYTLHRYNRGLKGSEDA